MSVENPGPPGGRQCEECGATRWDQKQVHGWIEQARAERDALREENARLTRERDDPRSEVDYLRNYVAELEIKLDRAATERRQACPECKGYGTAVYCTDTHAHRNGCGCPLTPCRRCRPEAERDALRARVEELEAAATAVATAHRLLIESVTPGPGFSADDRDKYNSLFSHWHATTRDLRALLSGGSQEPNPDTKENP